jgi:hypothetical protein
MAHTRRACLRDPHGQATVARTMPQRSPKSASIRPTVLALTRTRVSYPDWRASNSCVQVGRARS